MGYYEELVEEIRKAIREKDYQTASFLLERERRMPYIPEDTEKILISLQKDLDYAKSESERTSGQPSAEELLEMLNGGKEMQLRAASSLSDCSLRQYTEELQHYFDTEPLPEAQALLIEAIAEQEINESYTCFKDGLQYDFDGDSLTPVMKSGGFVVAYHLLSAWLNQNPSLLNAAKSVLIHACYMYLPLSYEREEGEQLAEDVLRKACEMMGEEELARKTINAWKQHCSQMS